jgi:hypothetical protein
MKTQNYPWQQPAWSRLVQYWQRNAFHHATLLTGPSGIGKQHFARLLARFILCHNQTNDACGQCSACHLEASATHPDLLLFTADNPLSLDQVRSMQEKLILSPQLRQHMVVVIDRIDLCHPAVINALLKQVEEPKAGVYFILTTLNREVLLPTLVSRCQTIDLGQNDAVSVTTYLQETLEENKQAWLLAEIFSQQPLHAKACLDVDMIALINSLCSSIQDQGLTQADHLELWNAVPEYCWFAAYHQVLTWVIFLQESIRLSDEVMRHFGPQLVRISMQYSKWLLHGHQQRFLEVMGMANTQVVTKRQVFIDYLLLPWGHEHAC